MSIIDVFFRGRTHVDLEEFPIYFRSFVNEWFYREEVKGRAKDPNSCPYEAYSLKMNIDLDHIIRIVYNDISNIDPKILNHMKTGISIESVPVTKQEKRPCLVHLENARLKRGRND